MTLPFHTAAYTNLAASQQTAGVATVIFGYDLSSPPDKLTAFNNCQLYVVALTVGRVTGGTGPYARFMRGRSFARESGSVSTLDAAPIVLGTDFLSVALAAATIDLTFSGNSIQAKATGVALINIDWTNYFWIYPTVF